MMPKLIHRSRIDWPALDDAPKYPLSDWRAYISRKLVAPVEAAAQRGDHSAVDLLSLYYLNLQLWRRAVASGNAKAAQWAEFDVDAAELLIRQFNSEHQRRTPIRRNPGASDRQQNHPARHTAQSVLQAV